MDLKIIKKRLFNILTHKEINTLDFYLFGSSLEKKLFEDVDILIIYENYEIVQKVKQHLNVELKDLLPHIICLSRTEEVQLSFIKIVNAYKIQL